ncbi:hypothetical protein CHUAL_011049 [Chamberlinius hualienensis]
MSFSKARTALEDVRRELTGENPVICKKALLRLAAVIKESVTNGLIINEKLESDACIQHLWQSCCHSSAFVSNGSCQIWLNLIQEGLADSSYVVNGLVSRILSSNFEIAVNLAKPLKELLVAQTKLYGQSIYQLRLPVHPFVTILQQKKEFWAVILEQIISIIYHEPLEIMHLLLLPVFKHILWRYSSTQVSGLKLAVVNELWDRMCISNNVLLKEFLWKTLFWLKSDSAISMIESQLEISQWSKLYARSLSDSDLDEGNLEELLLCLVSFVKKLSDHQIDISGSLTQMHLIGSKLTKASSTMNTDICIVILSQLLITAPETFYTSILPTCEILISRNGVNSFVIGLMFVSAVICINVSGLKSTNRSIFIQFMNFLSKLEELFRTTLLNKKLNEYKDLNFYKSSNFNEESLFAEQMVKLCYRLSNDSGEISRWLVSVEEHISNLEESKVQDLIIGLVCALVCQPRVEYDHFRRGICVLLKLAKLDSDKAPSIFVLIMYKLKLEKDPNKSFLICNAIPDFATSKVCIGPVLKTLMTFHKDLSMKAMAIRLLSNLWLKQERIYPVLHKVLVEESDKKSLDSSVTDQVELAKAASILDICKSKPHLYGNDLLTTLSKLVVYDSPYYGTSIAILALESIILLCRENVIDLKTTWKFLYSSFKTDYRPGVRIKFCQLLSLAAEQGLDETFVEKSVSLLWEFGLTSDPTVSAAAFNSLSKFKRSYHKLQHFPKEISDRVEASSKLVTLECKNDSQKNEDFEYYVPGYCFTDLLKTLTLVAAKDYGELLCNLVAQEVREMSRSLLVLSQSSKTSIANNDQSVSKLLIEKFAKASSPDIEQSSALGLLFGFDHHSQSVKDKARVYTVKLEQYLLKVSLDVNDWRKCVMYSSAWSSFMERLYYIMVENREWQISIQADPDDTTSIDLLKDEASLWSRDKIFDIIKNVVRVNPSAHGNAVIALAGLCRVIYKHSLLIGNTHHDGSQYMSHKHWIHAFSEVICICLEAQSNLVSGAFSWCHPGTGAMSETVRMYTALAASLLSYSSIASENQVAEKLLKCLQGGLDHDGRLFAKNFCYGIGLGQLVFNLTTEQACGKHSIMSSAEKFKDYCIHHNDTCILGLGFVAAAFCLENTDDTSAFVRSIITYLESRLNEESPSSTLFEHLAASYLISVTSAASANIIPLKKVYKLFKRWDDQKFADSYERSDAVVYGLLLEYLAAIDADYVEIKNNVLRKWIQLATTSKNIKEILAALHGLFSLTNGCYEGGYIFKKRRLQNQDLEALITLLRNTVIDVDDKVVQECCLWMLGCSYWKLSNSLGAKHEGTSDYSFLDNASILKSIVKCLKDFINSGCYEMKEIICICLKCMSQDLKQPYPDLNWSMYLDPLLYQSPEIQKLCIDVGIARAPHSLSAKTFITSLLDTKVLATLQENNKFLVLRQLRDIVKMVNPIRLQLFFNQILNVAFRSDADENVGIQLLKGLTEAVADANLSSTSLQVLHLTISEILNYIKPDKKVLWDHYCDTCVSLSEYAIEDIVDSHAADSQCLMKLTQFQCEMVGRGKFPLTWLNSRIDFISYSDCDKQIRGTLSRCFLMCFQLSIKHSNDITRVNWLLELMGHINDVCQSATHTPANISKAITNLFNIFSCAVLSWTDLKFRTVTVIPNMDNTNDDFIINCFPLGLQNLLAHSAWKSQSRKVIEWLFFLKQYIQTKQLKDSINESLFFLRHCDEFKTSSLWIRLIDELEM